MNFWILLIICILPIVLFTSLTKKFREKHPETFGYVFSVVATFIGIVIGLYVDGWQEEKSQKQKMIKMLEASKQEIIWLSKRTEKIKTIADTTSKSVLIKFLNLELPPFYIQTLRMDIANEVIHPLSYEEFNLIREHLLIDMQWVNVAFSKNENGELDKRLDKYNTDLLVTNTIIDLEIERLKGALSKKSFEEKIKEKIEITTLEE